MVRMFFFNFIFINFTRPTFFPVKVHAPSVITLAFLFHINPVLSRQFSTELNKSWPVDVSLRGSTLSNYSVSSKRVFIALLNTDNYAVSCTLVLSYKAREYHKKSLLASRSWSSNCHKFSTRLLQFSLIKKCYQILFSALDT